ncbi:NAD(P)-binding domain-containing protein [Streptomyces sp. NPDC056756]|uniref:NAD(P)-binding domain-containing protein n=1 Tax=Streptomyces sp. NPDC056756 TaxID=3345938 RepID=UPI00369B1A3A
MRIGIIGTGRIGSTLARILVAADHQVVLANARGPRSLASLLAELGPAGAGGAPPPGRTRRLRVRSAAGDG